MQTYILILQNEDQTILSQMYGYKLAQSNSNEQMRMSQQPKMMNYCILRNSIEEYASPAIYEMLAAPFIERPASKQYIKELKHSMHIYYI